MTARIFFGLLAAAILALGTVVQEAGAATPRMEHVLDVVSYADSATVCGIEVDVQLHWISNEFLRVGADGSEYHAINIRETNVYTNPETGKAFTQFSTYRNQEEKFRDNGDGTTTVYVKAVGPTRLSGANGVFFMDTTSFLATFVIDTQTREWVADGELIRSVGLHEERDVCEGVRAALL